MEWAQLVLVLVALQSITTLLPHGAAAEDPLSPFLAPAFDYICNKSDCGKGTCEVSPEHAFGYVCNCKPGWTQFHIGDHFRFLPCVVPNCSISYSCHNDSMPPAPSPLPNPLNFSLWDPCLYSFCGGGTCVKTSTSEHRCDCKAGFKNLLNDSSLPCYRDCSLGADCANLGITLSNSTSPASPPSLSDNGSSSGGDMLAPNTLLWMVVPVIPVAMAYTRFVELGVL
ncbi:uncharacterized protein LOC135608952 [Musa acuminata AAA Group]|uniref:uncharacterized protein LOC135608952 n=1 Tax=Musa acuminata AAA Group TaxID=214697 RepID=UPI0031E3A7E0